MYCILPGSNFLMVFRLSLSLEFVNPDGLPFTNSTGVNNAAIICSAHFDGSGLSLASWILSSSTFFHKLPRNANQEHNLNNFVYQIAYITYVTYIITGVHAMQSISCKVYACI